MTYRFVTRIKPEIKDGVVYIKNFALSSDTDCKIEVDYFDFEPRFAGFGSEAPMYTAYTIDFVVGKTERVTFSLKSL